MRFEQLDDVRRAPASALAPLQAEVLTTREELEALRGEWRWLWARSRATSRFPPPDWSLLREDFLTPAISRQVLTLRNEGRLVGVLPLVVRMEGGDRVLRLLGGGRLNASHLLMDGQLAPHGGAVFFAWLAGQFDAWDRCVLEPLAEGSPLLRAALPPGWGERHEPRGRLHRRILWPSWAMRQVRATGG